MGSRVTRARDELSKALDEQLALLVNSCRSFDAGVRIEGKRIALSLRLLLHSTKKQTGLLNYFGLQSWSLLSTNSLRNLPPNSIPFNNSGVLATSFGKKGLIVNAPADLTVFDKPNNWIPFTEWWETDVIHLARLGKGVDLGNPKGNPDEQFTRNRMVTVIADTDGGAHVDADIDRSYSNLTSNASIGGMVFVIDGQESQTVDSVHLSTVRHIANELLFSIDRNKCGFIGD